MDLRICGSYHKIVGIFKTMAVSIYNGIDQIKSTIIISKVWRQMPQAVSIPFMSNLVSSVRA